MSCAHSTSRTTSQRAWQRVVRRSRRGARRTSCVRGSAEGNATTRWTGRRPRRDWLRHALRRPAACCAMAPALAEGPLARVRVDVSTAGWRAEAKDAGCATSRAGCVDVLVATTRDRGRGRRANGTMMVVLDADRVRRVPAAPAARARRSRWPPRARACSSREAPDASPARERLAAVEATLDGFVLARWTSSSAGRATCSGHSQSGRRSSLRLLSVLRDEEASPSARGGVRARRRRPQLGRPPGLAAGPRPSARSGPRPGEVRGEGVTRIVARCRPWPAVAGSRGGTRPTSDRVREALFALWSRRSAGRRRSGPRPVRRGRGRSAWRRCRGAPPHAILVEQTPGRGRGAGASNVARWAARRRGDRRGRERRLAPDPARRYDLVFVDPPYAVPVERVHGAGRR